MATERYGRLGCSSPIPGRIFRQTWFEAVQGNVSANGRTQSSDYLSINLGVLVYAFHPATRCVLLSRQPTAKIIRILPSSSTDRIEGHDSIGRVLEPSADAVLIVNETEQLAHQQDNRSL